MNNWDDLAWVPRAVALGRRAVRAVAWAATVAGVAIGCGPAGGGDAGADATVAWPAHNPTITVPDGGLGLVSNNGSSQISMLDLAGAATIGQYRVGIQPFGNDGPHHLAVDPDAGHVFVALSYPPPTFSPGPHAAHGLSNQAGWVIELALSDLHEIARHQIDNNPGDIVLTPDRRRVIVTHFNLNQILRAGADAGMTDWSNFWILDAATLDRVASFPICEAAHGVAVNAASTRAYVACNGEDKLAIVHLDDPMFTVERFPVGPQASSHPWTYGPYAVLLTADERYLFVSDVPNDTRVVPGDIRVFNVATGAFEPEHTIITRSLAFFGAESTDGTYLLFAVQSPDGIVRVRRSDFSIERFAPVSRNDCQAPHEISRGPDGRFYLVCEGDKINPSRVVVVDPNTLAVSSPYPVGVYPDRIVFVPTGGSR